MKVTLVFVPPGGGEADYSMDFELPSLPQPGDYISITRPNRLGTEDFIVRRTWWFLQHPDNSLSGESITESVTGTCRGLTVECEFAEGENSTESHKKSCHMYRNKETGKILKFEDTAF